MTYTPGMVLAAIALVIAFSNEWVGRGDLGWALVAAVIASVVFDWILKIRAIWLPVVWIRKVYYRESSAKGVHRR